ncbi:hypothetical protein [Lentzea aerocolonigenes]|uniref:hypothetical protein n=1 Tax=Lentzea aerocolonigenes TaxID=68170 RepID=UPI0004C400A0|nr:hypothetical protein [Lentzea aerocolonigenes]
MNIELEDIKQLLRAEISGAMQHIDRRIDDVVEDLAQVKSGMATKADLEEVQEAIADIVTTALGAVDSTKQVDDHERRITRLEHHAA